MRTEQGRFVEDVDFEGVDVSEYLERDRIAVLVEAALVEPGATIIRVALAKLDAEREMLESNPQKDSVDIRKDVSYRLGVIHGLKCIASLPRSAHDALSE